MFDKKKFVHMRYKNYGEIKENATWKKQLIIFRRIHKIVKSDY